MLNLIFILNFILPLLFTTMKSSDMIKHFISHGIPKQTRISKTFDPIAFEIAISPKPLKIKFNEFD